MRFDWFALVFPALLLNYFGQGGLLLRDPAALENPFFLLVANWALYLLVALASAATIIASQAVISGAFSITRQAVQLGYLPRVRVLHTSEEIGQVYVPRVNAVLFLAVVLLVLGFQTSDNLGAAYGIAVTGEMTITTLLAFIGKGIYTVRLRYGFMDMPDVADDLARSPYPNLQFEPMTTSVVIGREKLLASTRPSPMSRWRRKLFIFLSQNAWDATEFFRLPPTGS